MNSVLGQSKMERPEVVEETLDPGLSSLATSAPPPPATTTTAPPIASSVPVCYFAVERFYHLPAM